MPQPSSSTSSSKPNAAAERVYSWPADRRDLLVVVLSAFLGLVVIDLGLAQVVNEAEGEVMRPGPGARGKLQQYFAYGRSIEDKIRDQVAESDEQAHPMARAGWPPDATELESLPNHASSESNLLIAAYGMSFTRNVMNMATERDSSVEVRFVGGPASTLGHTYSLFVADRDHHEAPVVVLGVLASSFVAFETVSHMTWNFDAPSPHFYPRYALEQGSLRVYEPPVGSTAELRRALRDPKQFEELVEWVATHDAFYDAITFRASLTDHSPIARVIRRGWGQRQFERARARAYGPEGFRNDSGAVDTAIALLIEAAKSTRERGQRFIVLLFCNRGYQDHLYRAIGVPLETQGVEVVSTHLLAPPDDLSLFVPDGHFTESARGRIVDFLLKRVHEAPASTR